MPIFKDGSCGSARIEELPVSFNSIFAMLKSLKMPKQCSCQNGGNCLLDGTCDCGDFEGEFCQKSSSVSRQLIGRLGGEIILVVTLLSFFNQEMAPTTPCCLCFHC